MSKPIKAVICIAIAEKIGVAITKVRAAEQGIKLAVEASADFVIGQLAVTKDNMLDRAYQSMNQKALDLLEDAGRRLQTADDYKAMQAVCKAEAKVLTNKARELRAEAKDL